MSGIRGKNTKPELAVRKLVHALGYRFRLHRRDLAGTPDLVLPRLRKIIFVHGCFWHRHPGCKFAYSPKSNSEFWLEKLNGNVRRDATVQQALHEAGWDVLIIWECEVVDMYALSYKVRTFLTRGPKPPSVRQPIMRQERKHG